MIATLSADRATVTMQGAKWSTTFPRNRLAEKLAFYRSLRDRGGKGGPGPYARFYEPSVKALERVEKIAKALGVM